MPAHASDRSMWRALRDEIRALVPRGRVMIAVDGEVGAGQSAFAAGLAEALAEDGTAVFRASIDGFRTPGAERDARGRTSPEGFYRDSFDVDALRRELVQPFRSADPSGFRLAVFDVERDERVDAPPVVAPADAVLIVDGLFLNRPELRGVWNWSVWLEAPLDVRYARMAERDGTDPDPASADNARHRGGEELYLREANPRARATVIVDNTDPAAPVRVYQDFC